MSLGEATPKVTCTTMSANMTRKINFRTRLVSLLDQYATILTIKADNVGSKHMQTVRKALRGQAEILMGKNTLIRNVIRQNAERYPHIEGLLPFIQGNTGLVFTNRDIGEIKSRLVSHKVRSAAKVNALAPTSVSIAAGNTGLEPSKTSFFQALSISSRINKGSISLDNPVLVVKEGQRVTHSQAALLQMLKITPFEYSLKVEMIYDKGEIYPASVTESVETNFMNNLRMAFANIAALGEGVGVTTPDSIMKFLQGGMAPSTTTLDRHGDPPTGMRGCDVQEPDDPADVDFDGMGLFGDDDEDGFEVSAKDEKEPSMGSLFGDDEDEEDDGGAGPAPKKPAAVDDGDDDGQEGGMGSLFGAEDEEEY